MFITSGIPFLAMLLSQPCCRAFRSDPGPKILTSLLQQGDDAQPSALDEDVIAVASDEDQNDEDEEGENPNPKDADKVAGPSSVEDAIAVAFHPAGVYLFNKEGGYTQISKKGWTFVANGISIGAKEVLLTTQFNTYRVKLEMPEASYEKLDKQIPGTTWGGPTLKKLSDPSNPIVFHTEGVFQIDSATGNYKKLSNETFHLTRGICYSADDPERAVIFKTSGVVRVDLPSMTTTKIATSSWTRARAVVYDSSRKAALVFTISGLFRVDLNTGVHEKVGNETWRTCRGAVYSHDNFALAATRDGMYRVNMDDGSSQRLTKGFWLRMRHLMPLASGELFSFRSDK